MEYGLKRRHGLHRNAATALAAVAAAAGLRAVVFGARPSPPAKLIETPSYGATVVPNGTYDQAFDLGAQARDHFGWYNRSTAFNPFTIEGKKTAAPDRGRSVDGEPVRGDRADPRRRHPGRAAKGFRDLETAGRTRPRPRSSRFSPRALGIAVARTPGIRP